MNLCPVPLFLIARPLPSTIMSHSTMAQNNSFLIKFETKSNRVKGLAFHPKRPWIAASLHNGTVQIFDYRMGTLLEKFEEHDGPVRGVHFHRSHGGDDYKIKVWNYKLRRCSFTLVGHLDYIRTVQFHHEHPWIVSASDDQTIRIWNWQNRSCMSVLTGHNHYVMSACFHPRDDLVLSASLDQSVRVWDIQALHAKSSNRGYDRPGSVTSDLFGTSDAVVKHGHDRGVNWAAFHPTMPLIVSGADDRFIKLWRMGDSKAWEVDSMRGHTNNVSSVLFLPKHDLVISDSEDKTIRVWDATKRTHLLTYRREDRFWILAAHPEVNLIAAGHDSGLLVFKLERERPAYALHGSDLYYIKDRYLRRTNINSASDVPFACLKRAPSLQATIRSMALVQGESSRMLLLTVGPTDAPTYELYVFPAQTRGNDSLDNVDPIRGTGVAAAFVARNKFAVLDRSKQITIRTVEGGRESGTPKIISPPYPNCDLIFPATLGHLLCKCDDRIVLFDCAQRLAVSEVIAPATKYVSWSSDGRHVALMSPHAVVICNKKLEILASLAEARVKSGTWDDDGIFIFTTVNHVKYVLTSGDSGILRSIDTTHYAAAATGGKLHSLDRDVFVHNMQLDLTEAHFKRALAAGRQDDIVRLVKSNKLVGQAIIGHLYRCGRPEVALHFVNEPSTRFELSLQCGNLSAAQECAEQLDRPDCWRRLAAESMRHGDFDRAETCCTKTKDFERLALMYTVTGNSEKLRRLSKIAEARGDGGQRMHVAMLLGDVLEKIAVLRSAGLHALAYASAFKHGQSDLAASILAELKEKDPEAAAAVEQEILQSGPGTLLLPPPPISCEGNWPRLEVQEGNWSAVLANAIQNKGSANDDVDEELDAEAGAGWGDDDLLGGGDKDSDVDAFRDAALDDDELDGGEAGGGWGIDELDLPESPGQGQAFAGAKGSKSSAFLPPSPGDSAVSMWLSSANAAECPSLFYFPDATAAGDMAAAADVAGVARTLKQQAGVRSLVPLKDAIALLAQASHGYCGGTPGVAAVAVGLHRNAVSATWTKSNCSLKPMLATTLSSLQERGKAALKHFTEGQFSECASVFRSVLQQLLLVVADEPGDADTCKELLGQSRDYLTAVIIETQRRTAEKDSPKRSCELAAYLAHCPLLPQLITLRQAVAKAVKAKNYATAGTLARRVMEMNPKKEVMDQILKVLSVCESQNSDTDQLEQAFVVCVVTQVPIYRGQQRIMCSACGSFAAPSAAGQTCPVCAVGGLGVDATGVSFRG